MSKIGGETRSRAWRAAAVVAVVLGVAWAGSAFLSTTPAPVVAPAPSVPAVPLAAVPPTSAPSPSPLAANPAAPAPSFDVVRVGPQGNAVIAGRAQPGAEVVVRDGTQEIARTQADRQGSFVAVPAAPLSPGGRALTLAARDGNAAEVKSEGSVVVLVPQAAPPAPDRAAAPSVAETPVAVLLPGTGAPRVLQTERPTGPLGLDTVDYDEKGSIRFAGHARTGSTLRVYVDNKAVGDAGAGADGTWVLTPTDAVAPGVHALRVDRLDPSGRVLSRVELPFQRAALPPAEAAGLLNGRVVVQPGQSLWRLARSAYGTGVRYTVIYLANRDQIRDPRLIYPGQAFSVPEGAR